MAQKKGILRIMKSLNLNRRPLHPAPDTSILATRSDIEQSKPQLLDVRSPAEFNGETSRAERKGHIPSAVNAPRKTLITDEGTLKSLLMTCVRCFPLWASIRIVKMSLSTAIQGYQPVMAYWHYVPQVSTTGRVYDSSWKEWGNVSDTDIE